MPITFKKALEVGEHSDCLISLLIKEFLWKGALDSNSRLKSWLGAVDKVKVKDWGKWADLTTQAVLNAATGDFCSTLERRLTDLEKHILAANVRKFVEIYGKSRLKVFKF
jgi:hypothetical protein